MADNKPINLAELSDEEIATLDPTTLEDPAAQEAPGETGDPPSGDSAEEDNDPEASGGAGSEDDPGEADDAGEGSTSSEEDGEAGNEEEGGEGPPSNPKSHQDEGEEEDTDTTPPESTSDLDYKEEYGKLMAPFKASKRTIQPQNIEEARRLMQMGVDYARKMQDMKPYQKVLRTLEQNDLLSDEKINFVIDLLGKKPEAIKKLLKDSDIDPMDLDLEGNNDYRPTDHMVGDSEIALEEVIDEIRGTPSFDKTVDVITNQWDKASRQLLMDNPQVIGYINSHIESGIFDKIMDRVASEKIFGKHKGLSDLETYKAVGDAMHAEGAFGESTPPAPTQPAPSTPGTSTQGERQNGSNGSVRDRKRAASPPKGSASAGKQMPNFLHDLSDEEIEKFDIHSL